MSAESGKFNFSVAAQKGTDTNNTINEAIQAQKNNEQKVSVPSKEEVAKELEEPYTDISSVTIALVQNYSLYRKVNSKVLPKRVDYIGSSINSSRVLSSNKTEIETYFPNIIGLAPNNEDFVTGVKAWLNNIRVAVDELGKTLNTSFYYNKKSSYLRIKAKIDAVNEEYDKVNRNNVIALEKALITKINKLNAIETEKCTLGNPVNIEEYLIYRHCLLYKDVAKDIAFINADRDIRFYFKDNQKEAEKLKKYREQINKAKANYVSALADDVLFDAIYIRYCVINNLPVISSLAEDRLAREIKLDKFSETEPLKFNEIFNNKDVKLMAQIEMLIARGELIRSDYNQQIMTTDGVTIGANMNEATAWFKDVNNTSVVNAYMAKLRNI